MIGIVTVSHSHALAEAAVALAAEMVPPDARPDALVSACAGLPGVEVMWVSFYPEAWGLTADTDILEEMTDDPEHAESILLREAPAAFHATWALLIDCVSGNIADRTSLAPADRSLNITALGDLSVPRLVGLRLHTLAVKALKRCRGWPKASSDSGCTWNWMLARSWFGSERVKMPSCDGAMVSGPRRRNA